MSPTVEKCFILTLSFNHLFIFDEWLYIKYIWPSAKLYMYILYIMIIGLIGNLNFDLPVQITDIKRLIAGNIHAKLRSLLTP